MQHAIMIDSEEIKLYFEANIKKEFQAIQRDRLAKTIRLLLLVVIGVGSMTLGLLSFFPTTTFIWLFIGCIIYFFIFGRNRKRMDHRAEFRKSILKGLVNFSDNKLTYHSHQFVPVGVMNESGFYSATLDPYNAPEMLGGQIGNSSYGISSVVATTTGETTQGYTDTVEVFRGLIMEVKMDHDFEGKTLIQSKSSSLEIPVLKSENEVPLSRMPYPNPTGKESFEILTNDPFGSGALANEKLLNVLESAVKGNISPIRMSIRSSCVVVFIPGEEKLFDGNAFGFNARYADIARYYQKIDFLQQLAAIVGKA